MEKDIPEKLVSTISCKQGAVRAVRFNASGSYCVSCGSDKSIKLWNPHRELLLKSYGGHGYEVLDAQPSSDNSQMCSGGLDKCVILWDVASGKIIRKYRAHAGPVNAVCFNEESTVIFSGSLDGTMRAWDCRSRQLEPIQVMNEAKDSVTAIQVSDHEILTGSADNRIRRYDLRIGQMFVDYIGKAVTCVNFTKDGQCTLSSTLDSTIRLLDKDTGEMLNEYTGHKNTDYKIGSCLNHQDTQIVSGSEDGNVYIWDLVEAKIVHKLEHPSKVVHSVAFHPTESCLLTAAEDHVYVWKSRYAPPIE